MKRLGMMLAVLSCAAVVVPTTVVTGHTKEYPTNISKVKRALVPGVGYRYWGRISSPDPACEKRRHVAVSVSIVQPTETDRTDSKGKWEIMSTFGYRTETFVTVSGANALIKGQHRHTCKTEQDSTVFNDSIEPGNP